MRTIHALTLIAWGVCTPLARANPPGSCATNSTQPDYRVVVHSPPPSVVMIEGDGDRKCLKLLGFCHKEKKPAREAAYWAPAPVMVPVPPQTCASSPPPCASAQSCQTNSGGGGGGNRMQNFYMGSDYASITAAGEDLRATITKLKSMRAEREAELAAIDTALAPITGLAPRANNRTVSLPIGPAPTTALGPTHHDLKDLNDKLDYLTALVDALAEDIRKTDPKAQLPAFDELNGLRKTKP